MNKRIIVFLVAVLVVIIASATTYSTLEAEAKVKTYTISPTSKPINSSYMKYKSYNASTKQYYLIRSYLEKIEANGGGTLILKKGTYTITNTLYLSSGTTLKLNTGVNLVKGKTTGKASFKPSKTMFQIIDNKVAALKKKKIGKYDGAYNVKITGSGTANINLNNSANSYGIVMAHAEKVQITGVNFKNNKVASFIHIVGSKSVTLTGNTFTKASATTKLPAILLEGATSNTKSYKVPWSKLDKTRNEKIKIVSNTFTNQYAAVQTLTYIKGILHQSITIKKNTFTSMRVEAIRMINWFKPTIDDNLFTSAGLKGKGVIIAIGVTNPTIKNNRFIKSAVPVSFEKITNNNAIVNVLSLDNKRDLASNKGQKLDTYEIKLTTVNNKEIGSSVAFSNIDELNKDEYIFNKQTNALNKSYPLKSTYNNQTKSYYVLRSILEQLEEQGGGKLIIEKGEYSISNSLFVPSNVTIELADGVTLLKGIDSSVASFPTSNSIFQFVAPSKGTVKGSVGGYNGSQNIKLFSKGRATIDLQSKFFSFAVIMAHTKNVTFENIDFLNMNSGHFIELDASKNVLINNCRFIGAMETETMMKEAINLDTPDLATKGFSSIWSNYDRTATEDVVIQNSAFEGLDRAIGTHKYSGDGTINGVKYKSMPHVRVTIRNNTFKDIRNDAIRAMNWDHPIIEENIFTNIGQGDTGKRAILSSGSDTPIFRNNDFSNVGRAIQFIPWKNSVNAEEYAIIVDKLTDESIAALKTNKGKNLNEYIIRISSKYLDYTNPLKVPIKQYQ